MFSSMLSLLGSLRGGSSFVTNSLRFRSSASAYLSRTPSNIGNTTTFTWSGWVKRGALGAGQVLFGCTITEGTAYSILNFNAADTLQFSNVFGGVVQWSLGTSQVFRDPSAWYHIVAVADTGNPTVADRLRLYINGVRATSFSSNIAPSINAGSYINSLNPHAIGRYGSTQYFDGYLTEVHLIDSQALTPASFGAIDSSTGVWAPRPYSGTYGTNGFYLKFANTSSVAALGNDSSGNVIPNNWTVNNVSLTAGATYDSMIDVPVNYSDGGNNRGNYAVLNPLDTDAGTRSISRGNLQVTDTVSLGTWAAGASSIRMTTGKWYFEATGSGPVTTSPTTNSAVIIGVVGTATTDSIPGTTTPSVSYRTDGQKYVNNVVTAYGATFTTEIIGCAFDADARTVEFFKNNVSQGIISIDASNIGYTFCVSCAWATAGQTFIDANFGQRPFIYTPPAGFRALNTNNLPTPSIVNGANFMAATTYTGNATARSLSNAVNSVSFQPDLVWIKSRTPGATNHALFDSVRGTTKYLSSNNSTNEQINANTLTAFGADGFSIGTDTTLVNANANSYVAWQWKAGGAAVSNTQGTITSQVSANTTAGLSVVTYTGTGANNPTVGHGLSVAPGLIFAKNRDTGSASTSWFVYHKDTGSGYYLTLNTADQRFLISGTSSGALGTSPSSTTFTLQAGSANSNNLNEIAKNYVAYCFAEIAGFSRFNSYTGNNSIDGPFVFCGFRPRFVMIKSTASSYQWRIIDASRNSFNLSDLEIYPSSSQVESNSAGKIDITSNGFKIRTGIGSGINDLEQYIFAAFAEVPTKYALAR